ncbi:hypothetical protein GCM10010151_56810 [Actinoallomurus spadix]|uniref:Secreted protein n=1 Tax=Actinoallomurus spadix TaxID=79912 RepID=A0ABN0XAY2_9ACTN
MLLIALAFLGGPDLLTSGHSPVPASAASSATERDNRAGEEPVGSASVTAHLMPGRRRIPGLPPDHESRSVLTTGQTGVTAAPPPGPAGALLDRDLTRHPLGSTPESLQVFRC